MTAPDRDAPPAGEVMETVGDVVSPTGAVPRSWMIFAIDGTPLESTAKTM